MIQAHISYTVRSPHPTSAWTLVHEERRHFADMPAAKDFLRQLYGQGHKRVPCYHDTRSRGTLQSGWIYCYKERDNGKTFYRQDWWSFSQVDHTVIDVRRSA